ADHIQLDDPGHRRLQLLRHRRPGRNEHRVHPAPVRQLEPVSDGAAWLVHVLENLKPGAVTAAQRQQRLPVTEGALDRQQSIPWLRDPLRRVSSFEEPMRVGAVPAPTRYPPGHKETQIMRPRKQGKVYIANQSFVANIGGVDQAFHEGRTLAYE